MSKSNIFLTIILLGSFLCGGSVFATHVPGGNVTYQCLGGNQYEITLTLYEDCGTAFETTSNETIQISNNCGITGLTSLSLVNSTFQVEVSQLCPSQLPSSECSGGTLPGVWQHTWTKIITLPANCDGWTLSYDLCCRNLATNTVGSSDHLFLQTVLNSTTAPCNSSPVINAYPVPFVCAGDNISWSPQVSEVDGNTITYSLVAALDGAGNPVTYAAGYSSTAPIPGIAVDAITGLVTFNTSTIGNYVVAILIEEFNASGNLVGSVVQDFQFEVIACPGNDSPSPPASGVTGFTANGTGATLTGSNQINMCAGDQFCADVVFSDINGTNTITLTSNAASILPGATFTQTGTNPVTGKICWTYTAGFTGNVISILADDGNCPVPAQSSYNIFLNLDPALVTTGNTTYCGTGSALLSATGTPNYTWSSVSGDPITIGTNFTCNPCANPTASPAQTTVYQVSDGSTCGVNTAQVTVTVVNNIGSITATIPTPDQTICPGECVNLTGIALEDFSSTSQPTYTASPGAGITKSNPTTTSIINVAGLGMTTIPPGGIESICFNITHTYDADLDIFLQCPNGTQLELTTDNGGSANNYTNACFTQGATTAITAGTAPFTGNFIPEGAGGLDALAGCTANGNWSLLVTDDGFGDSGTLISWSITFNDQTTGTGPATSFTWSPTTNMTGSTTLTPQVCPTATTAYTLTAYEVGGCFDTDVVNIIVSTPFTVALTPTDETCTGASDGSIVTNISGSTGPFTYSWSNGATVANPSGLAAGTYIVTVSDGGCSVTATTTINSGVTIAANATVNGPFCLYTDASGTANSFTFNGIASTISAGAISTYSWAFGDGTTGMGVTTPHSYTTAGNFTVTLTVSNGACTNSTTIPVTVYGMPSVILTPTDLVCNSDNSGQVLATGSGGIPVYTYTWGGLTPVAPNAGATDIETGLAAGTYTVTIIDGNSCAVSATTTIIEPSALSLTMSGNDALCNGAADGNALATPSGGTGALTYIWDDISFSTTASITGLVAGIYSVVVTDVVGCTITNSQLIGEPAAMTLTPSTTPASCGNSDGSSAVIATGGAGGYTYNWNTTPSQTGATASNLYAGSYAVIVTDANSCTITTNANIIDAGAPTLSIINVSNATCNGYSDGTAEASVTGGVPGYVYSWSNGETTAIAAALPAGTHSVTITDSTTPTGCVATASVTITDSPLLNGTILSSTNPFCPLATDGTATISVNGGTTAYSYLWNNGETTNPAISLGAGNVSVVVTDVQGCTVTDNVTLTDPTAITVTTSATNVLCNGASDGTVSATVSGGTTAYTYLWSNGANTLTISGLPVGAFSLVVTDVNNCTATSTGIVSQPSPVAVALSCTNITTPGGSNGTSTATVSGGTSGYIYNWSVSVATGNFVSGLTAGAVNVTVTDANSCTVTTSCVIAAPNCSVTGTVAVTPTLCLGSSDGTATATMTTGGNAPYTYLWDASAGNQTTTTATGLPLGTYNCVVSDINGCSITVTANIISPPAMIATITSVNPQCVGGASGEAIATVVSNGTPTYSYLWSNSTALQTAVALTAGSYSVTITDANNCIATSAITLTEPTAINPSIVGNNVSCFGANDGDATISVTGGSSPYSYQWDDPSFQTSATVIGIGNDTLHVTVTDINGCIATDSIKIIEPPLITVTTTSSNSTCGQADGSATVTGAGNGAAPYSYLWGANAANQTTATAVNIPSGSYDVVVSDAGGCSIIVTQSVNDAAGPVPVAITTANVICAGGSDGSVSVSATGGSTPYTYFWINGGVNVSASGLTAGHYSVTVTDVTGCSATASTSVSEPLALTTSVIASTNPSCFGFSDGTVNIGTSGGTGAYLYSWSNGAASNPASGFADGMASVTVTDAAGCTTMTSVLLTQPAVLVLNLAPTDVSCSGSSNGSINATVVGGTTNYSFVWSNGTNAANLVGVSAGPYTLSVTDVNSCVVTASDVINEPTLLTASILSTTNVSCNGFSDGNATVSASGGSSPYSYLWTTSGQTNPTAVSLTANNYVVSIIDVNNCVITVPVTITEPTAISLTLNPINPSCFGVNDGSITTSISGGGTAYSYVWSSVSVTADISGLGGGTYTATITDNNGCIISAASTLIEPTELILSSSATQSTCGQSDGSATVFVTQGDPSYTFAWSDLASQNTATASNLFAGNYTVTVTDGNGCTNSITQGVIDAGAPTASLLSQTNVSCFGYSDGFAQVAVAGGVVPYTYIWNDPNVQTSVSATGLPVGTWSATITDSNGCVATTNVVITEPTAISAIISSFTDVSCFGGTDGTATAIAAGGTSPYTYTWNNGQINPTANGLSPISYVVAVTDANNCPANVSVTIGQPLEMILSTTITNAFCFTPSGQICVSAINGAAPLSYNWSNGQSNACAGSLVPGSYIVSVTDVNGCLATSIDVVGNIPPGTPSIAGVNDVSCFGGNDGSASVSMSGNATPFTYLWDVNAMLQSTQTASGLSQGNYSVSVTDNNSCTVSTTVTINEPPAVMLTVTAIAADCFGNSTGVGVSSVTGGAAPYSYVWSDVLSSNGATVSGLPVGTYCVTATDFNGCIATDCITVTEPPALVLDSTVVSSNCNQNNGSACVIATGGVSNLYTYTWNNGNNLDCITLQLAGPHTVTVTDENGCREVLTAIISDINGPVATIISVTEVSCYGASDGSASVTVTGGTGLLSYVWSDGTTTPFLNGVPSGTYSVSITDAANCVASDVGFVNQPTQLLYNSSYVNPTCFGYNDGEASLVVAGGTTPYSYSWIGGGNAATYSNLSSGSYYVDITDANGCNISATYTLANPAQIAASFVVTDVSCNGGSDAVATVMPYNGIGGYNYLWTPTGQTSQTAFNLSAGNYSVVVTDGNGCSITTDTTLSEPPSLSSVILSSGDVTCFGGNDGFAQVQVFGGVAPFTYFWSTGVSTTATASNLSANTWYCDITDANGCTTSVSQLISQPTQLGASIINVNDASCFGVCDGDATVSASGGTAPYFYQWNACAGMQQSTTASNLCGDCGVSIVTITDNSGCATTANTNIGVPPALSVTSVSVQPHCGFSDGSICLTIVGGTNPYVPNWPTPISQTTNCVDSLSSGIYTITILDANACQYTEPVILNDIAGPTITYVNHTDVSCFGTSDGVVNTGIGGGTTPYQSICWETSPSSNYTACGAAGILLLAGDKTYCETVIDAAGCQASFCQYVYEPSEVQSAVVNYVDVSCFGVCDGSATVLAGGGTGAQSDITYVWSPSNQTTSTATGLCAGVFPVISSDLNGCSSTAYVTITEPPLLVASISVTDVSCFGESDGTAVVNVTGGTPFYIYTPYSTSNALPAGTVNVTVTDQHSCVATAVNTINQPSQLVASIQSTDAYCTESNGTASVFGVNGGTPGYSYSWNGSNVTSATHTGLYPNTNPYSAAVTDANGCVLNLIVAVNDQPGPEISGVGISTPLCNGECTGTATAIFTNGTSPYFYHWNDVAQQGVQTAVGLCAGNYNVTVKDANNCFAVASASVVEPTILAVAGVPSVVQLCAGQCETIYAAPTGGTTPSYSIVWGGAGAGLPNDNFGGHNVCPNPSTINTYSFTVTDGNGCTANNTIVVNTKGELLVDMPDTVETCLGNPVLISSTGFGGTSIADYEWGWTTGDTCLANITCDITVEPTDTTTYQVTLNDGCSAPGYGNIVVVVHPIPTPAYGVLENGGCPPYTAYFNGSSSMDNSSIEWDLNGDGVVDYTESNLMVGQSSNPIFIYEEPGQYTVSITVISEKQCSTTVAIQNYIDIPPSPIASFEATPVTVTLLNPFIEVNANATIGADSLYTWNFNDQFNTETGYGVTNEHFYQDTGWYTILLDVVNVQGCHDYDTLDIRVNSAFAIYAPNAFTPNDDAINDGFKLYGVGIDDTDFELLVFDRWGEIIFSTKKWNEKWSGNIKRTDKQAPNDVYVWKAFVKQIGAAANKAPEEFTGTVTVVR